jgi:hypothetical protein
MCTKGFFYGRSRHAVIKRAGLQLFSQLICSVLLWEVNANKSFNYCSCLV